jgi:hypothetical protein
MDKAQIEQYLNVGRGHSVVIDARELEDVPGNMRKVTIHRGNRVTIEYDKARAYAEGDSEGGGLKYVAEYPEMDVLLADLEEYLGSMIEEWSNFTESPLVPTTLDDPDPVKSLRYFEDLVRRSAVPLPQRGTYELAGVYWRHIAKYGEYREDKLLEEQEEELRRYDE